MIALKNLTCESDISALCAIESEICRVYKNSWQNHPGGVIFDRFLCSSSPADIFDYVRLIYAGETLIGYLLAFAGEGEFEYRLMPGYEYYAAEAVKAVELGFTQCKTLDALANSNNAELCKALEQNGYKKEDEERFQAVAELAKPELGECGWINERISILEEQDIPDRVKYAALPTGYETTETVYRQYMASAGYKNALDYVVRDEGNGAFIGFLTWWTDEGSKTALLEPVACLEEYRRRGIMKRALIHGFKELKKRGMEYVYVSTSVKNKASQALYLSAGFIKSGEACAYIKRR